MISRQLSAISLQIFCLFFILAALFLPSAVFAQAPSVPSPTTYPMPSSVSSTSPLYTDLLVSNLFHTFSCLSIGQSVIGQPCLTYQLTKNAQGVIQGVPVLSQVDTSGGILGTTTSLIGMLFTNPPVRTADYLASVGKDLGIVKEAHAQVIGSGAAVLNPILKLWEVSRNISYIIMIIIFVIIGLMVMFRTKINPQTVITAQAALPGLVLGLILITFSYFFAGLISDMAFVGTNMVGYYFTYAQNKPPQNLVEDASQRNVLNIFTPFTKILDTGKVKDALNTIWDDLGDPNIAWYDIVSLDPQRVIKILAMFMASQLLLPIGNLFPGLGTAAAGLGSVVAGQGFTLDIAVFALAFAGMVALIYAMLKLLLRLINNFLTIIFLTITAPFTFLASALPGRQGMATEWIQNLLANTLAFPAVLAVFYFVAFILGSSFTTRYCDRPGPPPQPCPFRISQNQTQNDYLLKSVYAEEGDIPKTTIVGSDTFPLFGGLNLDFIKLLLAFGALMAVPAVPDIIVRTIGKVSQAGQLLGQEIGASTGAGQRYAGQIQQGTTGAFGQIGPITPKTAYTLDPGGRVSVDPLHSQAGLIQQIRARWKAKKFF